MKLPSVFAVFALLGVSLATAATVPVYISSTPVQSPPNPAPQIDATTWINETTFEVNDFSFNGLPYQSVNTLNFRNEANGNMLGHPGYLFEYVNGNTRSRMSTWHNRGTIASFTSPTNSFRVLNPANWMLVSSDNITNSGSLHATPQGLLRLNGNTINLLRGRLRTGAPIQDVSFGSAFYMFWTNYFNEVGITDLYWGAGSNNVLSGAGSLMPLNSPPPSFSPDSVISPFHGVIDLFGGTNDFNTVPFFFGKGALTSSFVTNLAPNLISVQVVFVATNFFDTNLTTDITFYPNRLGGGPAPMIAQVGFHTVDRDVALDIDVTNSLYVMDGLALRTNINLIPNGGFGISARRPDTYVVSKSPYSSSSFVPGVPGNSTLTNFPLYRPSYASNAVGTLYTAYAAQLSTQNLTGSDPTNFPGRIEIWGQDVNLREARIRAESTFILSANNLVSNSLARVSAPYLCFDVGTTQPQLLVSNLAPSTVNRFSGNVSAWSATWENSDTANPGTTIRFHVMMVDYNLQTTQPVTVSKFFGRAPQIVLHDSLSVNQRLRLDASGLYVKSVGGLTFPPSWNWGSSNMLNIFNYTNDGIVSVPGVAVLGSDRGYPYSYVINRGTQTAQSQSIWANTFENYGSMVSQGNMFNLTATDAALKGRPLTREIQITTNVILVPARSTNYTTNIVFTGAATITAKGDLTISANNLSISNAVLQAGNGVQGALSLTANTRLTDAGPRVTNYVIASGGINVPKRPTQFSDLMGTYAMINAPAFSEVTMAWDGKNLGTTVMGYSNNLALAKLTLDGADGSVFRFLGIPSKDNAIYVDYLELLNNATNFADPAVFSFDSNFRIYFANANIAAKKLNGAQNDHIRWVSSFTGPLSTTNMVYPSGNVYPVNIQLARYPDFDSDGDGIPNHKDPTPIYVAESINLAIGRTATNRVLLSWQALANSTSYIEYKPAATASAWQLLRSTTAPANMRISATDTPLTGRTQRIYRVRIDLPPQ